MNDNSKTSSNTDSKLQSITPNITSQTLPVLQVGDVDLEPIIRLLQKFKLKLQLLNNNQPICGSFWGESEAGLIDDTIYVRNDTPIHSLFHEMCHYICMDENRRKSLDTNAEGDFEEENGVCYLQILLANDIPATTSERMMQDMDTWGYTFRLGSAKAWFESDAEDALAWLQDKKLLDMNNMPNYLLRVK